MKIQLEVIPKDLNRSFRLFETSSPLFNVPFHVHPEIEITEIIAGNGYRLIGDQRHDFESGDLVMIGAHLPHAYFGYQTQQVAQSKARVLQFEPTKMQIVTSKIPEFQVLKGVLEKAAFGIQLKGHAAAQVSAMIREAMRLPDLKAFLTVLEILHGFALAPEEEQQQICALGFQPHAVSKDYERLQNLLVFINTHFAESISQNTLAQHIGLTPSAFSREFKRLTGRTLSHYVNEVRIGRACLMLIENMMSIAQIAHECGYQTLSHFNQQFKSIKRMTPTKYKDAMLEQPHQ